MVALGNTPAAIPASRHIRFNAEPWAGMIELWNSPRRWEASWWPFGGLAAAALAAGEAFKVAMLKLLPHAILTEDDSRDVRPDGRRHLSPAARPTRPTPWILAERLISLAGRHQQRRPLCSRAPARRPSSRSRYRAGPLCVQQLEPLFVMLAHHDGLDKAPTLSSLLRGGIA